MKIRNLLLAVAVLLLSVGFSAYAVELSDISSGQLNINTATVEELKMLPFMDSQTAENIVLYRDSHGPFLSVDDLRNVKGINRTKLDDLRGHLSVDGASTYDPWGLL
jgi:competence ComEA-like helix-hairpin-helix protein